MNFVIMIDGIPKISVLVICYKQEELIKRAIDSLLAQKDYIYEICVSDDCSPDRTWEVLQEYGRLYPGLFKLHQHRPNVGIFENIEYTWTMPTGDIIYQLSGDDECGKDWFKTVIEYIQNNSIDYKNELFCIYGDFERRYANGDSFVSRNKAVLCNDALRLSLRKLLCNRSCCYSVKVLNKFKKCSQGRSHIAEDAQDRQLQLFSEKNYYIPHIGNIYHAGIGVSTKIYNECLFRERQEIMPYTEAFLAMHGYSFEGRDKYLSKLTQAKGAFFRQRTIKNRVIYIYYQLQCFDIHIQTIGALLKNIVYALVK